MQRLCGARLLCFGGRRDNRYSRFSVNATPVLPESFRIVVFFCWRACATPSPRRRRHYRRCDSSAVVMPLMISRVTPPTGRNNDFVFAVSPVCSATRKLELSNDYFRSRFAVAFGPGPALQSNSGPAADPSPLLYITVTFLVFLLCPLFENLIDLHTAGSRRVGGRRRRRLCGDINDVEAYLNV
ncbi:hypothetical protein EVAR_31523_1 [Eumeta japonica]|uniref:Uncharacterized protein n=1 Tax=Eumeta variegata TaxID=151549 RepID=A0A4C1YXH9_EUMVA|nr:hypothetical protein EVAR_31523_1 [Eumeta japonica]